MQVLRYILHLFSPKAPRSTRRHVRLMHHINRLAILLFLIGLLIYWLS